MRGDVNQSSARRALLVLEHLAGHPAGMVLGDIGEGLGLPKSAAHRLLALLEEAGYIQRLGTRYALTLKLTMLGLRHYVGTGLDDLVQPLLDRLAAETGELARVAVVDGARLVWVAKAQGARSGLRYDPPVDQDTGRAVVLHATATGKVWLATLPEAEALGIVAATGYRTPERFGPHAARGEEEFRHLLEATRGAGYGEAVEEGEPGTAAVAVAVRDTGPGGRGEAVATLSLAGPLIRFGSGRRAALAARLAAVAKELGAVWPLGAPGNAGRAAAGDRQGDGTGEEASDERRQSAAL
jgi:DNA-binding IclR family transcriptional regulator